MGASRGALPGNDAAGGRFAEKKARPRLQDWPQPTPAAMRATARDTVGPA
jgi:hypothetical protein